MQQITKKHVKCMLPSTAFQAQLENNDEVAKLHVPVSERKDTGKYKIALKNEFGEDSGDIDVIVLGK